MALQFDIALFENFNGGDVLVNGNDLVKYYENEGQIYLALFGGNVEGDTPAVPQNGRDHVGYWGNFFLPVENQFNSKTERTLKLNEISSKGRGIIQAAVDFDLTYLQKYANVTVTVAIVGNNKVSINIITEYFTGKKTLTVLTYSYVGGDGDFSILDFSTNDFN